MSQGKFRRVLDRFRNRREVPADSRTEVIEVDPGADYGDLTSVDLCDRAVAEGRIEPFLLVGERFGGEVAGPNVVLGPVGAAAAKQRIDDEIARALAQGASIGLDASFDYDEGKSRIPRAITFRLGSLGTRVLRLW